MENCYLDILALTNNMVPDQDMYLGKNYISEALEYEE